MTLRQGMMWRIGKASKEELLMALEWARMKHGDEVVTGRVFGFPADVEGIEEDSSITPGCWLVELDDRRQN